MAREIEGDFMEVVKVACQVRWLVHASYRTRGQGYFADNQPLAPPVFTPSLEGTEVPGTGMVTRIMKIL